MTGSEVCQMIAIIEGYPDKKITTEVVNKKQ
jgi:hypothetical protein